MGQDQPQQVTITASGAKGSYAANDQSVSRLGLGVLETPRSGTVLPAQLLLDQRPAQEANLVRNVAGLNQYSDYGGSYASYTLRGLWANNEFNYLRDGVPYLHLLEPMLFNVEQVEVIKGPSAIDFGTSAPGGFIDYVTKKPLANAAYGASVSFGSYRLANVTVDATGPLNADRTLLYRVTAGGETGGAFTRGIDPRRRGAAVSLSWQATASTRIGASVEIQKLDNRFNIGLPIPDADNPTSANVFPATANYGESNARYRGTFSRAEVRIDQSLSDDWLLHGVFAHTTTDRSVGYLYFNDIAGSQVNRGLYGFSENDDRRDAQLQLRGAFSTAGIRHAFVAGVDFSSADDDVGGPDIADISPIALSDPRPHGDAIDVPAPTDRVEEARQLGVYAQDALTFDNGFGVELGARASRFVDEKSDPRGNDKRVSPSASLTYTPVAGTMFYASYSSSLEPNDGVQLVGGGTPAPSIGKQVEIGVKRGWMGGRLVTTPAL